MEYDVFVVQIVTSGPEGYPKDEVIDIGICGVDLERMDVRSTYSMFILPKKELTEEKREYVGSSGISVNDLENGIGIEDACRDVKQLLYKNSAASFDIRNVFYRYMVNEPWDLTKEVSIMPSVCSRLPSSIGCGPPHDENLRIRAAYRSFGNDPMDIGNGRRALDHALMTSAMLMELRKNGKY